jgi:hypothetical protein
MEEFLNPENLAFLLKKLEPVQPVFLLAEMMVTGEFWV